ncbi:DUF4271 domain-containing protein [Maribacter algicola]|uniref:DUF4271 domain-containing protein n=1 Tax=Meishania litoralis TaxID=3434685 RepID=A0ACC7LIN1_9FLAO
MEPIIRTTENIDWITILIFGSLLFVVIAKGIFYNRFLNFAILPFNNKYIFMYNKKEKLVNWFHIFFSIFLIINFSLFVFFIWKAFSEPSQQIDAAVFLMILAGMIGFIGVKVLLQFANGFIFGTNRAISEIIFKKSSYLNHSGFIMFLANVILAYLLKDSKLVIYVALALIFFVNGIGWITLLRNHQKLISNNFFYFILYLCALEIAPLIILGSYLK